jgi:hypothetical protein
MSKVKKGVKRLHSLDAAEVSLVPEGANRRRFLIFKNKEGGSMPQHAELHKLIAQTDPEVMKKVEGMLKEHYPSRPENAGENAELHASGVDKAAHDQAHAAIKAIARIASPFKGKIPPALMHSVLDASGFVNPSSVASDTLEESGLDNPAAELGVGDASHVGDGHKESQYLSIPSKIEGEEDDVLKGWDGEDEDDHDESDGDGELGGGKQHGGSGVMKSHAHEAIERAEKAYRDCMAEKGFAKFPEGKMHLKMKKTKDGDSVDKNKGGKVSKAAPGAAPNPTVDPETRRKLELVTKSNSELVQKNAALEKRIADGEARERRKEIVTKAAEFKNVALPQEAIVEQLELADKAGKEMFEKVCKNFETLNAQAKSANLFGEIGSNLPNANSSSDSSWAKIEKAAEGYVAKSGEKCSTAEAVDRFLLTSEGKRMYAEHQSGRKDGI